MRRSSFFEFKALPGAGASSPAIHSEHFNTRATHIQCCPGQPRGFRLWLFHLGITGSTELEARLHSAMSKGLNQEWVGTASVSLDTGGQSNRMRRGIFMLVALMLFAANAFASAGPGALTQMGQANGSSGLWDGGVDAFSRINAETNNTFSYPAYGHVNGQATLSAWLDGNPVSISGYGTNAMQWEATMELCPGNHQLKVAALHPSAEIRVPGRNGKTYAAPNLIYHYMKDCGYLPPQEFLEALRNSKIL